MRKIGAKLVLAQDGTFLRDSYIEIQNDGTISAVVDTRGRLHEIAGLEYYNGILCPGFVNAHCHLELSHLSGLIPPQCGLPNFISQVVKLRNAREPAKASAMRVADRFMQASGIAAVGDISNTADSFALKEHSNIYYHTFIEVFGTGSNAAHNFARAQELFNAYSPKIAMSIVPHAAYSVHPHLFEIIADHARSHHLIQTVHSQETDSENMMFSHRSGSLWDGLTRLGFDYSWLDAHARSSLDYMLPQLSHAAQVLLVHNTFARSEDIRSAMQVLGADRCFFVLCPLSNLYIEGTLPTLNEFLPYSSNICIGTDSLASNRKLSILEELKCLQDALPQHPLAELLRWATMNGARALGIDHRFGTFEAGKSPGAVLIENVDLANAKLLPSSTVKVLV